MHPILFQIGPVTLYSYGLMIAIGFMVAITLASRRAKRLGLDPERIQSLGLVTLVSGLVGGRLGYVVLYWDFYLQNPLEILRLDHGGLVFYGGLGLGILMGLLYIRRSKLPMAKTVELMIPPLVLAHALGRIGCFLNGCCYGKFTDLPWGVAFPPETLHRHPTQLYEFAALLLLFVGLTVLGRRNFKEWTVPILYGLLYGTWRFFIEFVRGDNPQVLWGLTVFQLVSLPIIAACGGLLIGRLFRRTA